MILGTLDLALQLYRTLSTDRTVYSDADWAGRLCSLPWGQSYFLVLQAMAAVSRLSAEAEYNAVAKPASHGTPLPYPLRNHCLL